MFSDALTHGPLTRYVKLQVAHAPGMPETFSPAADFKGNRYLATPACITTRASRTCRDACRDRLLAVAGKTFPAFSAHAHPQFYASVKRSIETVWRIYASENMAIICLDDGLLPGRRQTVIWTNVGLLSLETFGTNSIEILMEIQTFSLTKMRLKMSSGKWRPFCLGLNLLKLD